MATSTPRLTAVASGGSSSKICRREPPAPTFGAGGFPRLPRLAGQDSDVDVLSSRILLRPADLGRSLPFYRDVLGLAIYRQFGTPADPGVVFFLGSGMLEVSGRSDGPPGRSVMIWVQVRGVHA